MKVVSLCHPPFHEFFALNEKEKTQRLELENKELKRKLEDQEQKRIARIKSKQIKNGVDNASKK